MTWYAHSRLREDGELLWERDAWGESEMMDQWMELVTYQHDGLDLVDIESIANGL